LTSTELRPINQRLPPLAGLLDDTLDQAIRALQRRLLIADHPGLNLAALKVTDNAIDQALKSAGLYGKDAALQLDARIAQSKGATQEAAVFLRMALAVQTQEPTLFELTTDYHAKFSLAVRDAYWFYPAPFGPFDDSSAHIVSLFEKSAADPGLRLLALELAGRRDVKSLKPHVEASQDDPRQMPAAHYALACMGLAGELTKRYVKAALASNEPLLIPPTMATVAADPRLADDATVSATPTHAEMLARNLLSIALLPFTVTVLVPAWIARGYHVGLAPARSAGPGVLQGFGLVLVGHARQDNAVQVQVRPEGVGVDVSRVQHFLGVGV